jgi:hypothetical protein
MFRALIEEKVVTFGELQRAITAQFGRMVSSGLFRVAVSKDLLWETYLASFPSGTNPLFREQTEHDCTCCRHFVRALGDSATIIDGKLVSLWDVEIGGRYQPVVDALAALVKASPVDNLLMHSEHIVGTPSNRQLIDGTVLTWEHFHAALPAECVVSGKDIGPKLSDSRATHDVMLRGLTEITMESLDAILDLIAQNSLYRGEENKFAVDAFRKLKIAFDAVASDGRDLFVWSRVRSTAPSVSRIRNTSIGTLLVDLSEGADLDVAVPAFEAKLNPTNYKRPTALVSKAMIQRAKETIEGLGLTSALERRYATIDDLTINNVLFADRSAKRALDADVFARLTERIPESIKNLDRVEEIPVEKFFADVLPKAEGLEVLFENRHAVNLVSLVAPVHTDARLMFKWPNGFSWSYAGELADSIKERVKRAGGRVDGDLRCSLSWFNYDDLDLHMHEPTGEHIFFGNKRSAHGTGGELDVDMNAGSGQTRNAVENITYPARRQMHDGTYILAVHNYCQRETKDLGFDAEIEFDGIVHTFHYDKAMRTGQTVVVAEVSWSRKDGFKITKSLPSSQASRKAWGLDTQTFCKVSAVMLSPNHWDGHPVGNKHWFFMLEGCVNEERARGFFNEFLKPELDPHRKAMELVGSTMRTEESDRQLSGVGISSTRRDHLTCRVHGSFNRVVKVMF